MPSIKPRPLDVEKEGHSSRGASLVADTLKPAPWLPIPQATRRRRSREVQDACRLFVHYGHPMGEIHKMSNCTNEAIHKARIEDEWDSFRDEVMFSRLGTTEIERAVQIKATGATESERAEQMRIADKLASERDEMLERLPRMTRGTRIYRAMLDDIARVTEMIDQYTGKKALDNELERRRGAIARVKERLAVRAIENGKADQGTIELDDSAVIDFMESPGVDPDKIGLGEGSLRSLPSFVRPPDAGDPGPDKPLEIDLSAS